jgi:hypothetical protein
LERRTFSQPVPANLPRSIFCLALSLTPAFRPVLYPRIGTSRFNGFSQSTVIARPNSLRSTFAGAIAMKVRGFNWGQNNPR